MPFRVIIFKQLNVHNSTKIHKNSSTEKREQHTIAFICKVALVPWNKKRKFESICAIWNIDEINVTIICFKFCEKTSDERIACADE